MPGQDGHLSRPEKKYISTPMRFKKTSMLSSCYGGLTFWPAEERRNRANISLAGQHHRRQSKIYLSPEHDKKTKNKNKTKQQNNASSKDNNVNTTKENKNNTNDHNNKNNNDKVDAAWTNGHGRRRIQNFEAPDLTSPATRWFQLSVVLNSTSRPFLWISATSIASIFLKTCYVPSLSICFKLSFHNIPNLTGTHCTGWIRERARWSESCVLIGYPSGQEVQDTVRDFRQGSRNKKFSFWPYNEPLLNQTCSVQIAEYFASFFFAFLLANIQPSWPNAWPITHIVCYFTTTASGSKKSYRSPHTEPPIMIIKISFVINLKQRRTLLCFANFARLRSGCSWTFFVAHGSCNHAWRQAHYLSSHHSTTTSRGALVEKEK